MASLENFFEIKLVQVRFFKANGPAEGRAVRFEKPNTAKKVRVHVPGCPGKPAGYVRGVYRRFLHFPTFSNFRNLLGGVHSYNFLRFMLFREGRSQKTFKGGHVQRGELRLNFGSFFF